MLYFYGKAGKLQPSIPTKICSCSSRGISWVLGRTSLISSNFSSADSPGGLGEKQGVDPYFTNVIELYEISNHIMLSQAPACSSLGDRLGLPRLYQNEDHFGIVVQLDACLNKWEDSLPKTLRYNPSHGDGNAVLLRQGVALRLR